METVSKRVLDMIDVQLLNLLQVNAQMSNVELPQSVNLSVAAVHGRVKRLEQEGFIKKRVTIVEQEKLGLELTIFIFISTNIHQEGELAILEEELGKMEEVLECYCITGDHDYLLKTVHKSRTDLEKFIRNLNKLSVTRVQTSLALREVKSTTVLPIK